MPQPHFTHRPIAVLRSAGLQGVLRPPGDRMLSHYALLLGASARGETTIEGLAENADVFATGRALQAMGVRILRQGSRWHVAGLGTCGLLTPEAPLHFSASSTALRLCLGLAVPQGIALTCTGDAALSARSQQGLLAALAGFGAAPTDAGTVKLPFQLRAPRLPMPIAFQLPAPSAQLKAAMLLGALALPGFSAVTEPRATDSIIEHLLQTFGARLETSTTDGGRRIEMEGLPLLRARHLDIPGDSSLAAHAVVATLLTPNSEVLIEDVLAWPSRLAFVETLQQMGARIDIVRPRQLPGGLPIADLRVIHSPLRGLEIVAEQLALTSEAFPLLAVAAAGAEGDTRIHGLDALADRDSDQVATLILALAANGVVARLDGDALVIEGRGRLRGRGRVVSNGDAAVDMAALVLGMAAEEQVTLDDQSAIAHIYPGLIADFEALGASFLHYS